MSSVDLELTVVITNLTSLARSLLSEQRTLLLLCTVLICALARKEAFERKSNCAEIGSI